MVSVSQSDTGADVAPPRCPRCGHPVAWAANPARPFCSIGCQLIDLGDWLDERYRLPGPPVGASLPAELEALEPTRGGDSDPKSPRGA